MRFIKDLQESDKQELERIVKESSFYRERQRAQAILLSAQGHTMNQLTEIFKVDRDTVGKWFDRFETQNTTGLKDAPGRGRPSKLNAAQKKSI